MPLGGKAVEVRGLRELSRDLKRIDKELPKEMRQASMGVARLVADEARANAGAGTKIQRKAASAIKARAGAARAAIAVTPTPSVPFALGAFYGAVKFKQFEPWVGTSWRAGRPDEGPYAINPAIASLEGEIVRVYGEAVNDLTQRAFPSRGVR